VRLASSLSRFARYTKIDLLLHQLASSYSPHDLCTGVRQMADLKAADNETLMHYLVRLIDRKYTHLTELPSDFPSLQQAARESIKQTLADLVALNNAVELVKPEFEAQTSPGDPFASMMRDFYTKAHEQLQATREDLNRIQDEYKGLLKYFGEAETTDFQDFMGNLVFLCTIFQKACDDNARKEQLILEAAKNAERKRRTVRHAESNDRSIAHSRARHDRWNARREPAEHQDHKTRSLVHRVKMCSTVLSAACVRVEHSAGATRSSPSTLSSAAPARSRCRAEYLSAPPRNESLPPPPPLPHQQAPPTCNTTTTTLPIHPIVHIYRVSSIPFHSIQYFPLDKANLRFHKVQTPIRKA